MRHRLTVILLVLVGLTATPGVAGALELARPVHGAVLARFDMPTRYGAGHRGVDLAATPGTPVRAAAAGTVTFAGTVVGNRWVTVDHGPLRTTVGPMRTIGVTRGHRVDTGTVLGTSGSAHGTPAVHWSARRGDTYLDPLQATPHVATLLPTGATRATHSPPVPVTPSGPHGRVR